MGPPRGLRMEEGISNNPAPNPPRAATGERLRVGIAAAFTAAAILFFFFQLFHIGVDVRAGLWTEPHMAEDLNDAMNKADMILRSSREVAHLAPSDPLSPRQIINGWVGFYDEMDQGSSNAYIKLDYPPMRSLVLTLWMRHVQENYPGLHDFPHDPTPILVGNRQRIVTDEIVEPMLEINTAAEGVAAVSMFFLVWFWANRGGEKWRWGDRLLWGPPVLLAGMLVLQPMFGWTLAPASVDIHPPIDNLVTSIPFWISLVLGFLSAVCLARFLPPPFRGPACGLVAATLVWTNPPMLIDGHIWPQWDVWLPAFFLLAALLASLDWWLCAGLVLGVGCMFKGQILFAAPVLLLCPLLAGWPVRFGKIVAGLAAGAGVIVSPWLLSNPSAVHYAIGVMAAGLIVCAAAGGGPAIARCAGSLRRVNVHRRRPETPLSDPTHESVAVPGPAERIAPYLHIIRWVALLCAAILVLWIFFGQNWLLRVFILLLAAVVLAGPWVLPRRLWPAYGVLVAAGGIWIAGFALDGKFSWWDVGFAYGTRRWQQMQLGAFSLSNLCSILQERFGWRLHDPGMDWPLKLDLRQTLGLIYLLAVVACAIGASIHIRRRDPRFLVALTAPWVLFPTILTQMAARYTILPAVIAASLVAVSTGMSLLQLLLTIFACIMLGNQYTNGVYGDYRSAPVTPLITQPTFPGMAWAALLTAAIFLYCGVTTTRCTKQGEIEL
jgi:hypothetical protein